MNAPATTELLRDCMTRVHSRVRSDALIGIIFRKEEMQSQVEAGIDLTPDTEFLQVRSIRSQKPKAYGAHKHLPLTRTTTATQECLIVMRGAIEAHFYDVDDQPLGVFVIRAGDCLVALAGGHAFNIIEDDTQFYELKNGPYFGANKDKMPIAMINV